jgi:UDP-2,3-diacylglucosamine pyrophosphatase LpxH
MRQNFLRNVQKKFVIYTVKEYEYLIVSDVHMTSLVCQRDKFEHVIKNVKAKNVVLNGDIIDVNHTNRLKKQDWHILSLLSKLSKNSNCYWNSGNHDADVSGLLSQFIGFEHGREHSCIINDNNILITHGDQFDSFIGDYPLLTTIGSGLYYWLQAIDPKQQRIPRFLKQRSKNFIQAGKRVRNNAIKFAEANKYSSVICSHVHQAEVTKVNSITYANTGCFTFAECFYITIDKLGQIELHQV